VGVVHEENAMKDDETRRGERAEQVALFRYGLISDLIHPAAGD
jgi:hypothetical protein